MTTTESVVLWGCLILLLWLALTLKALLHQLDRLRFEMFQLRNAVERTEGLVDRKGEIVLARVDVLTRRLLGDDLDDDGHP